MSLLPALAASRSIASYSSVGATKSSIPKVSTPTWTGLKLRSQHADDSIDQERRAAICGPSETGLALDEGHGKAPLSLGKTRTALGAALPLTARCPIPAVFLFVLGDCAPVCQKATGVRSSCNRTFVQFRLGRSSRRSDLATGLPPGGTRDRQNGTRRMQRFLRARRSSAGMGASRVDRGLGVMSTLCDADR